MNIEKFTIDFLKALKRNNNRQWFHKNKDRYLQAQGNMIAWVDALIHEMNKHDDIQTETGKESLYRIYNDVRFNDDKTPYNPRFAGHLKRRKPYLRGGYYFWIKPGGARIGCGFTYPNPFDLKRIREDIASNFKDWKKLLGKRGITTVYGTMLGNQVKTSPKGYAKDNAAIELLRHKQFWFEHSFTDDEVLASDFLKNVSRNYKAIRPFFDYMSEVLSTNANGESMVQKPIR